MYEGDDLFGEFSGVGESAQSALPDEFSGDDLFVEGSGIREVARSDDSAGVDDASDHEADADEEPPLDVVDVPAEFKIGYYYYYYYYY